MTASSSSISKVRVQHDLPRIDLPAYPSMPTISTDTYEPDLGERAPEINAIQERCNWLPSDGELTTRYPEFVLLEQPQHSAGLLKLPLELLDQISSHLQASSAVAFKLTCHSTLRTKPPLAEVLTRLEYNHEESFRTKAYIEDLTRYHRALVGDSSRLSRCKHASCSACKARHPTNDFSFKELCKPATVRRCWAMAGLSLFGQSIHYRSEWEKAWLGKPSWTFSPRHGISIKRKAQKTRPQLLRDATRRLRARMRSPQSAVQTPTAEASPEPRPNALSPEVVPRWLATSPQPEDRSEHAPVRKTIAKNHSTTSTPPSSSIPADLPSPTPARRPASQAPNSIPFPSPAADSLTQLLSALPHLGLSAQSSSPLSYSSAPASANDPSRASSTITTAATFPGASHSRRVLPRRSAPSKRRKVVLPVTWTPPTTAATGQKNKHKRDVLVPKGPSRARGPRWKVGRMKTDLTDMTDRSDRTDVTEGADRSDGEGGSDGSDGEDGEDGSNESGESDGSDEEA